jgi:hypothetical protein
LRAAFRIPRSINKRFNLLGPSSARRHPSMGEAKEPKDRIVAAPLEDVRKARGDALVAVPLEQVRSARGETLVALPRSKVASLKAFRRIRADRWFGAIGLALVLLGVALIFSWEKAPVVEKRYAVEWPLSTELLASDAARFTCPDVQCTGATETYTVNVNQTNVTAVTFWVQWNDDVAGENEDLSEGDRFEVTFSGPDGSNITSVTEQRVGGVAGMNMSYTFLLALPPDLGAVSPANNDAEAMALIGDRTTRNGTGDWTITVRLVSAVDDWNDPEQRNLAAAAGQKCPAGSPPNVCTRDTGNDYTFGFQITRYSLTIQRQF